MEYNRIIFDKSLSSKRHITRISIWFVSVAAQMVFKNDLGYVHQVQEAAFVALRRLDDTQPSGCLSRLLL